MQPTPQPQPQQGGVGGITSTISDLVTQYPMLKTLGIAALTGTAAGVAGGQLKKHTGQGPGGFLSGLAGAAAPFLYEGLTNTGVGYNVNRWGLDGAWKSKDDLSDTMNRRGYVKKHLLGNEVSRFMGGDTNQRAGLGTLYSDLSGGMHKREVAAIDPEVRKVLARRAAKRTDNLFALGNGEVSRRANRNV